MTMFSMRHIVAVVSLVLCISASSCATVEYEASKDLADSKDLSSDLILLGLLKKYLALYYPVAAGGACGEHSVQYKQGVNDRKLWAIKMLDSSTKIPDGFLAGNINQLGNYDECVSVSAPDAGYGTFIGQHCLVYISIKANESATGATAAAGSPEQQYVMEKIQEYLRTAQQGSVDVRELRQTIESLEGRATISGIPGIPDSFGFRWSYCLPSSCSPADVTEHLTNGLAPFGLVGTAEDRFCHTREHVPFVWLDWFTISLMVLLGLLAGLSTTYDLMVTDKASRQPLLLSFSLYTNGKRLLDTTTTGSDVLPAVHGVRFLSICWVVYCHRWGMVAEIPTPSLQFYQDFTTDPGRMYILNGGLSVDSFFLLSGMLASYIFLKEMAKGTSFNVPFYYLHRYIRVTPTVLMMILFVMSVFSHFGSGPCWNFALWEGNNCLKYWWRDLLYIQNYFSMADICMTQTWYVAADMQLFWLSPIVLIPLWKWPKIGKPLLGFWIAVGFFTNFSINYMEEAHIGGGGIQSYMMHMRLPVYLIGIALGYLLHHTKKEAPVMNKWTVVVGWAAALFLTVGTVYLAAPFIINPGEYNRFLHAFIIAIHKPAFALGLSWIIYACVRGYGGFINTFLSWSFFIPLSRLTFCIYLTHMAVQYAPLGQLRNPLNIDDYIVIPQYFGDMVMATGFATILSMLVEVPTMNLEKIVFGRGSTKQKPKIAEKDDVVYVEEAKQN